MTKKLVADLMVDYLERRDVKYVFGLCGHTVIGMLDALSRSKKVKYISNRHEAVAYVYEHEHVDKLLALKDVRRNHLLELLLYRL